MALSVWRIARMSNVPRDIKKSQFIQESTIPAGATFDFVYNGTNYKIPIEDMVTAFGTTGTLSQLGDPAQTPILNVNGTDNEIRNLEDGSGVKASISPLGGAQLDHNFQQDATGAEIVKNITSASPIFRSLVAGSGISVGVQNGYIQIALSATPAATKTVIVNELADFPTAVAGVITLEADTMYFVTNDIETSSRFVAGLNSTLAGSDGALINLVYTGSGTMFTSTNVAFKLKDLRITCASGTLIESTCASGSALIQIIRCIFPECDVVGSFGGCFALDLENCSFLDIKTDGLSFTGNTTVININAVIAYINGGTLLDLGTATVSALSLGTTFITAAAGTTVLSGLADSGNINAGGLATVFNVRSSGTGTALSGIGPDDIRWEFLLNSTIPNSINSILATNAGNTVTIAATDTPVIIGATWALDHENRFEGTAGGRFTYLGKGAHVNITATITAELDGTPTDRDCTFYVFKNGVEVTSSGVQRTMVTGSPGNLSLIWQEDLETNDYLELFVENNDSTEDIIINNAILGING